MEPPVPTVSLEEEEEENGDLESANKITEKAMVHLRTMRLQLEQLNKFRRRFAVEEEKVVHLKIQQEFVGRVVDSAEDFAKWAFRFHVFRVGEYKPGRKETRFLGHMNRLWTQQMVPAITEASQIMNDMCSRIVDFIIKAEDLELTRGRILAEIQANLMRCTMVSDHLNKTLVPMTKMSLDQLKRFEIARQRSLRRRIPSTRRQRERAERRRRELRRRAFVEEEKRKRQEGQSGTGTTAEAIDGGAGSWKASGLTEEGVRFWN